MKGSFLGEFQELVLIIILILKDNAYGVSIQQELKDRTGRVVSRGALHTALKRLEEKGYIKSETGGAEAIRGGRSKRFYTVSNTGRSALEEVRSLREQLWQVIPAV